MAIELLAGDYIATTPENVVESAGDKAVDRMVDVSDNRVHCHQCRQKTRIFAACKNLRNNRLCMVKLCGKCLLNRYGENVAEIAVVAGWACPKCRGICNCSVCMKRRGHQPTGQLSNAAKATGFSSVSDMLLKSAEHLNHEDVGSTVVNASLEQENVSYPRKRGNEISLDGQLDAHLPKSAGKKAKGMLNGEAVHNITSNIFNQDPDMIVLNQEGIKGTDLTRVAGIVVPAEDFGNALEFLEFCSVFEKVLEVKSGEAEYVVQDIFHGQTGHRGKQCSTVQFHIHLLTLILSEQGERFVKPSPSYGQNSWFKALKKCLSESHNKASLVISLERAADYDALNASEKLEALNLLCYEVLGTEKLREWIADQNKLIGKKVEEAKQQILEARDKVKTLEKKIKDYLAKSTDARDGEQEATGSHSKSEAAQALAQLLELKALPLKINRTAPSTRVEPVFMGHNGHLFWKLSCSDESDVLHQYVGKGDTLTLNEKWVALIAEEREAIGKLLSKRRG